MLSSLQSHRADAERKLFVHAQSRFKCSARVRLSSLTYERSFASMMDNRSNSERLKNIMELQGCLRLHSDYHVRVLVDIADWDSNKVRVEARENGSLPELMVPLDYRVVAQDHGSLINAARQQLQWPNDWWVVDVYLTIPTGGNDPIDSNQQKLQAQLVRSLREHYPNIRQPPDGLIYERIRYYGGHLGHPRDVQAENDWWAALYNVPKTKKPMYLKAFLNHESFPQAFDSLLPIPGLWKDMHIGSLHTLVYMRCDEPIICALETILQTYLNLMGGNTDLLSHIDAHSVELLQSRAPKVSERDMRHLKEKMDKGELFPSMHDQNIRDGVWSRLQLIDVPIPTLATFFRDRRYLDVAKKVMSCLFQQDKDNIVTVDQGVSGVYGDGNDESIEDRNRKIRAGLRDLWRFSLQWGFEMVDSHKRRVPRKPTAAELDSILGVTGSAESLDRVLLCRHFFRLAQSWGFTVASSLEVDGNTLALLPSTTPCDHPEGAGQDEPVQRRCGLPFLYSVQADRYALSSDALEQVWEPSRVTTRLIRRSFFRAFFGYLGSGITGNPIPDSQPSRAEEDVIFFNENADEDMGLDGPQPINTTPIIVQLPPNEPQVDPVHDVSPIPMLNSTHFLSPALSTVQWRSNDANTQGLPLEVFLPDHPVRSIAMPDDEGEVIAFFTQLHTLGFRIFAVDRNQGERDISSRDTYSFYYSNNTTAKLTARLLRGDAVYQPSAPGSKKRKVAESCENQIKFLDEKVQEWERKKMEAQATTLGRLTLPQT